MNFNCQENSDYSYNNKKKKYFYDFNTKRVPVQNLNMKIKNLQYT